MSILVFRPIEYDGDSKYKKAANLWGTKFKSM